MGRRSIGLDIGTNAVRVAIIDHSDRARLRTFGQVALPPEAMREGEVADPAAVTHAIGRLWKELDLKRTDVRIGIASPRVIVRPVELPAMDEKDLSGALRFQAQELIPIPIDDAVFDFQVLESFSDDDGVEQQRILLAAAHREPVQRLVDVVRAANLNPIAVDLVPLALVRSLGFEPMADGTSEAIVSIGAGVTSVIVHENGVPRFVRTLGVGGRILTEVAARDLELSADAAEAIKRRATDAPDALFERAKGVLDRPLGDLLDEIRGSLDYYRTQVDAPPIRRVVLTGGTALLPEVPQRLATMMNLPVVLGGPRSLIDVADIGFAADELAMLDPFLAVPVGLALGADATNHVINLMPEERRAGAPSRLVKIVAAATVCAVVGGIGLLTVQRASEESDARDAVVTQEAKLNQSRATLTQLGGVQQALDSINANQSRLQAVYATEIDWTQVLDQVATNMPDDVALTSFRGSAQTGGTAAPGATGQRTAAPAAQLNFQGRGLSYDSVASWITQLQNAPSLEGVWVNSVSKSQSSSDAGTTGAGVTFQSDAQLAAGTQSSRLAELQNEIGRNR
ncbi:MAG: type IV pilus assembly protein PilM [Acidimicrobiia bacterium]